MSKMNAEEGKLIRLAILIVLLLLSFLVVYELGVGIEELVMILIYGGLIFIGLTLFMLKKILPSISCFVILFLIIGAFWGLEGGHIRNYYHDASASKFCQENVRIGNPCSCPVTSFSGVKNPCNSMPFGEGIFYKITPFEIPPSPPSPITGEMLPPHDSYRRFKSEPTDLGKITYLPVFIIHELMGAPPNDIFFLIWIWLYPQMLIGMLIFGVVGWLSEKVIK